MTYAAAAVLLPQLGIPVDAVGIVRRSDHVSTMSCAGPGGRPQHNRDHLGQSQLELGPLFLHRSARIAPPPRVLDLSSRAARGTCGGVPSPKHPTHTTDSPQVPHLSSRPARGTWAGVPSPSHPAPDSPFTPDGSAIVATFDKADFSPRSYYTYTAALFRNGQSVAEVEISRDNREARFDIPGLSGVFTVAVKACVTFDSVENCGAFGSHGDRQLVISGSGS